MTFSVRMILQTGFEALRPEPGARLRRMLGAGAAALWLALGAALIAAPPVWAGEAALVSVDGGKAPLATGQSSFMLSGWGGPDLPVLAYVPYSVEPSAAPILIMMHGARRRPGRYLDEWKDLAKKHRFIVVAPHFTREAYPGSRSYNLGNRETADGAPQDEAVWSFSAIEPLFDAVTARLGSAQTRYHLYGHSAGSQFVHRFLYFKPDARVKRYYAANAGWYTAPDFTEAYPYGLQGSGIDEQAMRGVFGKDVVVLLGDADTDTTADSLRTTPEAMRQGPHRYARGLYFFRYARAQAEALDAPFNWRIGIVEGVAHSNAGMAAAAAPMID